jgi:hypothetical protein
VLCSQESRYAKFVQRLFAMFPQGGPGVALLLLRISVAAIFFLNAAKLVHLSSEPLIFAVVLLISILLLVGLLTPLLSVIACASGVASLLSAPHSGNFIYLFTIFDAAALALLGPGAYSVDARLFGRRVTVVSPRKDLKRPEKDLKQSK